jgi:hypothetical protein
MKLSVNLYVEAMVAEATVAEAGLMVVAAVQSRQLLDQTQAVRLHKVTARATQPKGYQ